MIVRQSEALALSFSLRPPSSGARRPYRASGLVLGRTTGFRRREGTPRLRPKQALIEAPAKRREGWTPGLQASPGEQRESTRSGPSPIGSPRNSNCEKFTNASERGSQFPFASTRKSARAGAVSLARRRTFSVPARALERLDDDHPAAATRASARRQRCFGLAVGLSVALWGETLGGGEQLAGALDVLRRDDPHQRVVDGPRQPAAIHHQLRPEAQNVGRGSLLLLMVLVSPLPHHVP